MKMRDTFDMFKDQLFRGNRKDLLPIAEEIMYEYYSDVEFDADGTPEERREIIHSFIKKCIETTIQEEIEREKNNIDLLEVIE